MIKKLTVMLLALIFVISTGGIIYKLYDYKQAKDTLNEAYELALPPSTVEEVIPEEPSDEIAKLDSPYEAAEYIDLEGEKLPLVELYEEPTPLAALPKPIPQNAMMLLDVALEPLREVNSDVLGWIYIPDGDISHPLMRSHDNSEYLTHAWDGSKSRSGAIFLERKNNKDLDDFNTLIYGHNMKNYKFFAPLHSYDELEYRNSVPYVYILTDGQLRQYEVFAAYKASIYSDTYRLYFPDDTVKQTAIDHYLESSVWDSGIALTPEDRVLTLSTCTRAGHDDYRWVVQAKLCYIWEL